KVAAVGAADAADKADVMTQERDDVQQPVLGTDAALAHVLAAKDLLPDQGDEDGVLDVVVEGIAVGDVLQRHAAGPVDDVLVIGLESAVHAPITGSQLLPESVDQDLGRVEHGWCSSASEETARDTAEHPQVARAVVSA